jgi:lysozyme
MKTSQTGIDLIKQFEGCRLKAYLCPAGIPTIGYGHTHGVKIGDKITQELAELLLKDDLNSEFEYYVNNYSLNINQNQFDALVSFVYNVGPGNFQKSTLLKKARKNPNDLTIAGEFMKWTKAKGKELPGLRKRRILESELYFKKI